LMIANGLSLNHLMISAGVILFAISDSILSIRLFYYKFDYSDFLVLMTYWPGQMLICYGWIQYYDDLVNIKKI